MLTDHDKISLITSIYQSGSNVSQFLNDLKLLSAALDGPKSETASETLPVEEKTETPDIDQKTKMIINTWKTVLTASDPESPNPTLLKFQEKFLSDNVYDSSSTKSNHKFYLAARSVGITTAFALHTARSLIQQPNVKIWYVTESNDGIDSFCNGVFALLPKDLIDSKNEKSIKLSNGSYINFITQPALINSFKETRGTNAQKVAQYISRWGTPDILLIDDAESVSFNFITELLGLVHQCPNVIMTGGISDKKGLPFCIMTDAKNLWIEKTILPWYEGTVTDQDFIKSCLTEDQYLESQMCQFPRKPKEIIIESRLSVAYNELVNKLFKPVMVNGKPDMEIKPNLSPQDVNYLVDFKNKYLTPWMHKVGEINDNSEVEIIEEIDKNTGVRVFRISVGNIPAERVAEILEKTKIGYRDLSA